MPRLLNIIAKDIRRDWVAMSPAARPYYEAMTVLVSIKDSYGMDNAKSIVLYFLANAASWRGDVARRIKAELKELVK